MNNTKICSKCGRELPISEFHNDKTHKDGHRSECRECTKQRNKKYQTEHKNDVLEQKKLYYQRNRETILNNCKERRLKNPEYMEQYSKSLTGYCVRIRNNNICADRKFKRIGEELPNEYPTIADYINFLQQPDFYDGKQYHFTEMGLDRIDNSKPHTLDNVVPCTTKHNKQRGTMSFEEFLTKFNSK